MQNSLQMRKNGILDPDNIGGSLKPNIDSFIEDSVDHLLLVYLKNV